jgi:hypothetical protein
MGTPIAFTSLAPVQGIAAAAAGAVFSQVSEGQDNPQGHQGQEENTQSIHGYVLK